VPEHPTQAASKRAAHPPHDAIEGSALDEQHFAEHGERPRGVLRAQASARGDDVVDGAQQFERRGRPHEARHRDDQTRLAVRQGVGEFREARSRRLADPRQSEVEMRRLAAILDRMTEQDHDLGTHGRIGEYPGESADARDDSTTAFVGQEPSNLVVALSDGGEQVTVLVNGDSDRHARRRGELMQQVEDERPRSLAVERLRRGPDHEQESWFPLDRFARRGGDRNETDDVPAIRREKGPARFAFDDRRQQLDRDPNARSSDASTIKRSAGMRSSRSRGR
jgi:hypothetical protein